jgi:hypothetical protein
VIYSEGRRQAALMLFTAFIVLSFQATVSAVDAMDHHAETGLPGIVFNDGLLKVSVRNQNFKAVLDDVAEKAGIEITTKYLSDEKITITFDYRPLEEGIKKLVAGTSHIFFYAPGNNSNTDRLSHVLILPPAGEKSIAESMVKDQKPPDDPALKAQDKNLPQNLLMDKEALTKEINEIIKSMQGEKGSPLYPSDKEISKMVNDALEEIQKHQIEKVIEESYQDQLRVPDQELKLQDRK